MLRRISLAEEFEDTTGVSPWSFIYYFHMPTRLIPFGNNEYYHVYNRGIKRQPTFLVKKDYERFLTTLSYYRFKNPPTKLANFLKIARAEREKIFSKLKNSKEILVDIICYVFMPNHYHFLLKQNVDNGISTFIRKTINSYSRYFNTKYHRDGSLFKGVFMAKHVDSDEQLLHLTRYIHLNPLISLSVKEKDYPNYLWSSLAEYMSTKKSIVSTDLIMSNFKSPKVYLDYILDRKDYAKELDSIKHMILES